MKSIIIILTFVVFIATGCGTTQIAASSSSTNIYVNGVFKGKGSIEVARLGVPKKLYVEAKEGFEVIGSKQIKRKFDFATFIIGYFTYGTGFLWAWRFPSYVFIPTTYDSSPSNNTFEGPPQKSPWDNPPPPSNWK